MAETRSLVAGVNALFRARESSRPSGRVLDDPFAAHLAEQDPRVLALRYGRFVAPGLRGMIDELQTAHCVRHRAVDELVLAAISDGFDQIVVLGAGYDMRPSRFAATLDARPALRWIEVDQREIFARKQKRLARVPGVRAAEVATIDLSSGTIEQDLAALALDRTRPACFVVEGVIHYLTSEAAARLVRALGRAAPKVRVVMSFIRSEVYDGAPSLFIELVTLLREIPRLHFTRAKLDALAAEGGLAVRGTWSLGEQIEVFAREARGRRVGLGQDVALLEGEVL
ncbi:class I SAM-dependent methyltransferase [Myxococcota bacterium]|nr:class I SAM-dependent methyltransferase [Myxococcota bacterium]